MLLSGIEIKVNEILGRIVGGRSVCVSLKCSVPRWCVLVLEIPPQSHIEDARVRTESQRKLHLDALPEKVLRRVIRLGRLMCGSASRFRFNGRIGMGCAQNWA